MSETEGGDGRDAGRDVDALLLEAILEARRVVGIIAEIMRGRGTDGKEVARG